jgi:hypothetical protein
MFDGVLVWIDPISGERDRSLLDRQLRQIAAGGTWVSAHPDTIQRMGTKEVLYRTRSLGWGADTRLYRSVDELRAGLRAGIATAHTRVLKQNRGNGGIGVWKVEAVDPSNELVRVQHAAPRDDVTEEMPLDAFVTRCEQYLSGDGLVIDQPFATRLAEGMIRAYLVEREVVGFARQQPASPADPRTAPSPDRVLGMPSAKTMFDPDEPEFRSLRHHLEEEWVPGLQQLTGVTDDSLPVLWDADFLYGPRTERGDDTYMLCEINVSSVIPFPPAAPANIAAAVARR